MKLFMVTDGNEILSVSLLEQEIRGDLEYILEEDKYKDNNYLKPTIKEIELEGQIYCGENVVSIVTVYNDPIKAFVNEPVAAYFERVNMSKNDDEIGKYKTKFFIVEV